MRMRIPLPLFRRLPHGIDGQQQTKAAVPLGFGRQTIAWTVGRRDLFVGSSIELIQLLKLFARDRIASNSGTSLVVQALEACGELVRPKVMQEQFASAHSAADKAVPPGFFLPAQDAEKNPVAGANLTDGSYPVSV